MSQSSDFKVKMRAVAPSSSEMKAFCKELLTLRDRSEQVARLRRRTIVTCFRKLGQDPDLAIARMLELMNVVERDLKRIRRRLL